MKGNEDQVGIAFAISAIIGTFILAVVFGICIGYTIWG